MRPILLVVASNLGAWRFAALNRSGGPEAVLELTERELRLPARQAENTALTLRIVFIGGRDGGTSQPREAGWFDRATLQSIGFGCSRPVAQEHAAHYRSRPPRMTYAAMEYEGESWRGKMAQLASDSPLPPAPPGAGPHRRRAQHPTAGSRTATLTRHWMVTRPAAKSPSVVRRFLSDLEYVDCIAPCLPWKVTHSGSGRAKT